jgi:nitrite reductase (NADH) small subunit/3-phenylpropionate/trans-cinnamate dioxygenase ferredoxin subunit
VSDFVKVGSIDRFREGRGRRVSVEGRAVAVFLRKGRLHAVGDRCPHMGASLSEGRLEEGRVVCSWHGWSFDCETGRCDRKSWARIPRFEVRLEGKEVLLRPLDEVEEPPGDPEGESGGEGSQVR